MFSFKLILKRTKIKIKIGMIYFYCCSRIHINQYVSLCFKCSQTLIKQLFNTQSIKQKFQPCLALIRKVVTNSGLRFRKKHYLNLLHCSHGHSLMLAKAPLCSFFSSLQYFEDSEEMEIFPKHHPKIDRNRDIVPVFCAKP